MKLVFAIILLIWAASAQIYWTPSTLQAGVITIPGNGSLISWKAAPYLLYNQGAEKTWKLETEKCNLPGLSYTPTSGILKVFTPETYVDFTIDSAQYNASMVNNVYFCYLSTYMADDPSVNSTYIITYNVVSDWCDFHSGDYCIMGTCNNITHKCDCDINFYGPTCQQYCSANDTCLGHGSCNSKTGHCDCDTNYYGLRCKAYCNPSECPANSKCSATGCECDYGYYGTNCATFCMANSTCSGYGRCNGFGTCDCVDSRWGKNCENKCGCAHGYCDTNGQCKCGIDYYGPNCTIQCNHIWDCNAGGMCSKDGSCNCFDLNFGANCQYSGILFIAISGGAVLIIVVSIIIWRVVVNKRKRAGYQQIVN